MDVFELRDRLIDDYRDYILSFVQPRDKRVWDAVTKAIDDGALWPEPLIQMNPAFEPGGDVETLVGKGILHPLCARVFRKDKERGPGTPLRLYRHQLEAIEAARRGVNYVLTTGTGPGKSLSYIVPIVDHVLRKGSGRGIQAIVVYPMNALANSQKQELEKFLAHGFSKPPVTFARYTGQETDEQRDPNEVGAAALHEWQHLKNNDPRLDPSLAVTPAMAQQQACTECSSHCAVLAALRARYNETGLLPPCKLWTHVMEASERECFWCAWGVGAAGPPASNPCQVTAPPCSG